MYQILGGDGKEYGPVTAETLRQWVNEGRAGGQSQVRPEGAAGWQALSSLPEFAPLFAAAPPGMTAASGGRPVAPAPNSGLAITALVLGITGFFCGITALPGLILGLVAMRKIKASEGRLGGQGLALAGTIVSALSMIASVAVIAVYAALLFPAMAKAKQKAQTIQCVNNLKQLSLAAIMYSNDNRDVFPASTNWCDALIPYAGNAQVFVCPADGMQSRSGYAFNAAVAAMPQADVPSDTVMIFECDTGWNASGGKELILARPRHYKTLVIAFADGSVQQVQESRLPQLRWAPDSKTGNANK